MAGIRGGTHFSGCTKRLFLQTTSLFVLKSARRGGDGADDLELEILDLP